MVRRLGLSTAVLLVTLPTLARPATAAPERAASGRSDARQDIAWKRAARSIVRVESTRNLKDMGTGTGFFHRLPDGRLGIVTANHVVKGAKAIKIAIPLEKGNKAIRLDAKVRGASARADVAVLEISREAEKQLPADIRPLELGRPKIGEEAIIPGFGLSEYGVDRGTVRKVYSSRVETDDTVVPGNSGGAMLNRDGEVIGLAVLTKTLFTGRNTAEFVPPEIVGDVIRTIDEGDLRYGQVKHAQLGFGIEQVRDWQTLDRVERSGFERGMRWPVKVSSVSKVGPSAGKLQPGDIILAYDRGGKEEISSVTRLGKLAMTMRPNDSLKLKVLRGEEMIDVEISNLPSTFQHSIAKLRKVGLETETVEVEQKPYQDMPENDHLALPNTAIRIKKVDPASPAAGLELRPDDIVFQGAVLADLGEGKIGAIEAGVVDTDELVDLLTGAHGPHAATGQKLDVAAVHHLHILRGDKHEVLKKSKELVVPTPKGPKKLEAPDPTFGKDLIDALAGLDLVEKDGAGTN